METPDLPGQVPAVSDQESPPVVQVTPGDKPESPAVPTPNEEAARYRTQLRAAEKERDALKAQIQAKADADLSELARAQKALSDRDAALTTAQDQARAARLENVLLRTVGKHNIRPDAQAAALKLIDPALLEWDDATGTYSEASVDRALKALVKDHPFLVAAPVPAVPAPGPSGFAPQGSVGNGAADDAGRRNQTAISGRW